MTLSNQVPAWTLQQIDATIAAEGIQKVVVGAVILLQGNVLLLHRHSKGIMGNLIELPNGVVAQNQSIINALVQKVLEKTGMGVVFIDRYVGSFDYLSGNGEHTRQFNFRVTVQPGPIVLAHDEYSQYHLIPPTVGNLDWLKLSDSTKRIILNTT